MKYVSIDIETTGLDPINNQIIEFGAVIEDTNNILPLDELPTFQAYITHPNKTLTGHIVALNMNAKIIEILTKQKELESIYNFIRVDDLAHDFLFWLFNNGFELETKHENTPEEYKIVKSINVAGKNFESLDKKFLNNIPEFKKLIKIRRRILDPAILFIDWKNDETLPSLGECNKRIGHTKEVSHRAVDDAIDVIRLLRTKYTK